MQREDGFQLIDGTRSNIYGPLKREVYCLKLYRGIKKPLPKMHTLHYKEKLSESDIWCKCMAILTEIWP